jgi:hypothetical protein
VLQHHFSGRSGQYVQLAASLAVRLALTGSARLGVVAAPSLLTDTAQRIRDFSAQLGWDRAGLGFLTYDRTSAFNPFSYSDFPGAAPPSGWTDSRSAHAWHSAVDHAAGLVQRPKRRAPRTACRPPTHAVTATIGPSSGGPSQRHLRLEAATQDGDLGTGHHRRTTAVAHQSQGATFFSTQVEIQLQSFTLYWNRNNIAAARLTYAGISVAGVRGNLWWSS